ncbi:hypothetical protein KOI35_42615 [Actinoplanes bogorensis]|uniref:Uncharacterized protein n=1 Tax=Paractinoplanes bogorensis TaxID=1610840 RepID=A0ABS5Z6W1_9ACTN|nr:hypothetical protein [Actinoplanes bogorensis]MBU2670215.1 hypothetical protein [Actinoplanes bogorensis]
MTAFARLPVNPDDGFPQAFRLALGSATYVVTLTVTVVEESLLDGGEPLVLPRPGAFMTVEVTRESPGPARTVLRRKLVPGLELQGAEVVLKAVTMIVDPRNLGAAGAFGSQVLVGVAARWVL